MPEKIIVVLGATGAQGSSVINNLLEERKWKIKGVCRHTDSENCQRLKGKGVEVIRADMNSDNGWSEVFKNAYAVYALTDFWKDENAGKEFEQGKRIVDWALKANVTHFIWSTLPNVAKESNNKFNVPHFTDKAKVEEYLRTKNFKYTSFIAPAFYYQNFASFVPPKEVDGTWVWELPISRSGYITAFDVADIGKGVRMMLNNPEEWNMKYLPMAAEHMHPQDFIEQFKEITGLKAKFEAISRSEYASRKTPGAKELAEMFGWFEEYTYYGKRDITITKKVIPDMKSWKNWLQTTGWTPKKQ